jgi:hypothetical protein
LGEKFLNFWKPISKEILDAVFAEEGESPKVSLSSHKFHTNSSK